MILDEHTIERIKAASAGITHGSIEIVIDNNKPFIDIIQHDRLRITRPVPSASDTLGTGGKQYP